MIGGADLAAVILLSILVGVIIGAIGTMWLAYRANKRSGYRVY